MHALNVIQLDGLLPIDIAAGRAHVCIVTSDLEVACWGNNGNGQLGIASITNIGNQPGEIGDVHGIDFGAVDAVSVSAGKDTSCAGFADGSSRCGHAAPAPARAARA